MKITKPESQDLENILVLWKGQYGYHSNLDSEYYISNLDQLESKFRSYLIKAIEKNKPHILVAKDGEKLVGFITFEINKADYFDTKIERYGEVIELFVKKENRNKGIGKLLLISAEKYFRDKNVKYIEIQCSSFNRNALGFYKSQSYISRQVLLFKKIR